MQKSTIDNLHNISQTIYLGYLSQQQFQIGPQDCQISFFGGKPLWLKCPSKQQCICEHCNGALTFLGQLYCPFEAQHCYHRILYILFCQSCKHYFRCIRQQAPKQWKPNCTNINNQMQTLKITIKVLSQKSYDVENQSLSKKQLNSIIQKTKFQLQEQRLIQEAGSDQEDDQEEDNQQYKQYRKESQAINTELSEPMQQQLESSKKQAQQQGQQQEEIKKQQIDYVFQLYKKVMKQIQNPCMLYTNVPVLYNKQQLNSKHNCKCGSKLELQIELTEQLLLMNDKQSMQKLILMDWGTIFIYTCSRSCEQSSHQQLIAQFEIDPINEGSIEKLKKKKKNRKRAQQKAKSKSKSKQESKQKQIKQKQCGKQDQQVEGDWD